MPTIPPVDPLHYQLIGGALAAALRAADPQAAVARALSLNAGFLTVLDAADSADGAVLPLDEPTRYQLGQIRRVLVVGAGKAGVGMAEGLRQVFDRAGHKLRGCINVKEGFSSGTERVGGIAIQEAGHPLPDERGLEGSRRIVSLALGAETDDLLIVLLSGGGSALLEWPAAGLSLADLQATTRSLMYAGADIHQLNIVRKHLSQVKGGGLARLAAPAQVLTIIFSDVIGDDPAIIASGPTTPDPSSYADALAVIDRLGVGPTLPRAALRHLEAGARGEHPDTPKPGSSVFANCRQAIVASNASAVAAVQHALLGSVRAVGASSVGSSSLRQPLALYGEAREVGSTLVERLSANLEHPALLLPADSFAVSNIAPNQLAAPDCWAIVLGGETSVTVRGLGRGGRNQELALTAAIALDERRAQLAAYRLTIATFATDGDDGSGGAAGAIADTDTVTRATMLGLDAHAYLAANDSYSFWQLLDQRATAAWPDQPHQQIITGPSGTNVNDLCIIIGQRR